ncbi:MAG: UxaA family hydrolase [Bacillota bacterium]
MEILGYRRPDGKVGIRNHVLIMSVIVCANEVTDRIYRAVEGTVPVTHPYGCGQLGVDFEQSKRTLVGFATNPNVAGVIVVGLGCEKMEAPMMVKEIAKSGKPVELLIIQDAGGTSKAVQKGIGMAQALVQEAQKIPKVPIKMSDLILGLECGGSDTTSGLASNPAVGVASDLLIRDGGTVVLSETAEIIGAEHLLAKRCLTVEVGQDLLNIVKSAEQDAVKMGVDLRGTQPSPGNIMGGLTTIEEKSLGCLRKAGTGVVQGVLPYAAPVEGKGLFVMDTPGQDVESITGMVAGGCQMVLFTTGRGTPVGCPIAPVIKITGNHRTYQLMEENMDINAGTVMQGIETIESVGQRIYQLMQEVAGGQLTKAEALKHYEFAITRIGPSI